MNEEIKELKVQTVTKCAKDGAVYLAILKEQDGRRILPVLLELCEAFQLLMKMKGMRGSISLPSSMADIMKLMFHQCDMNLVEVRIAAVQAGVTYCHLLYHVQGAMHMIRYGKASDCLLLAYTFDCPITISESLLEQQYMREIGDGTYSIPVNSVNIEALQEALNRAIEDENYELASQLRDEIERRK